MAIDGGRSRIYVLGRECILTIDGNEIQGASDVMVRESVTEVDATSFNHRSISTIVTQRTLELSVSIPDVSYARWLYERRWTLFDGFYVPSIFEVSLEGGVVQFTAKTFTIHDIDADEPLDGMVVPRMTFKEWRDGPIPITSSATTATGV